MGSEYVIMPPRYLGPNLYILDNNNHVLDCPDIDQWAKWMVTDKRLLKRTPLPTGATVSTIFLGIAYPDENQDGQPLLFETMIFSGGDLNGETTRSTTWSRALRNHDELVAKLTSRCAYCGTLNMKNEAQCSHCGVNF